MYLTPGAFAPPVEDSRGWGQPLNRQTEAGGEAVGVQGDAVRWFDPPALAGGEVHVWVAAKDVPGAPVNVRHLLAAYLGLAPESVRLVRGEHGKPRLAGDAPNLRFNLSHSGSLCLYAVARDIEVGVDVEVRGRARNALAAAERAFGASAREWLSQLDEPDRERAFLGLWTGHEARLKCLGLGLGAGADKQRAAQCWSASLDVGEQGIAALATSRPPTHVRVWR